MNKINIPTEFNIFGQTYKIVFKKKITKSDDLGIHDRDEKLIELKQPCKGNDKNNVEETYLHEVIHCILDHLGYDDLSDNEAFVTQVSKALHQILKTSKYAENNNKRSSS